MTLTPFPPLELLVPDTTLLRCCAVQLDPVAIVAGHERKFEPHPRLGQNSDIESGNIPVPHNRGASTGRGNVDPISGACRAGAGYRRALDIQKDVCRGDLNAVAGVSCGRQIYRRQVVAAW